jgi:hypothetical protein
MDGLHTTDMAGRCFKCGEQVGSDLRGCKAPPYKSPREIELERENADLRVDVAKLCEENDRFNRRITQMDSDAYFCELEETRARLSQILTDPEYEGGVQYWIQKHDALMADALKLRQQLTQG